MTATLFFVLNFLAVFCLASPAQPPSVQDIKSIAQKGYAGANPPLGYGETTGGQGGKVFKVTTDAELQNAMHVRNISQFTVLYSSIIGQSRQENNTYHGNYSRLHSFKSDIKYVDYWSRTRCNSHKKRHQYQEYSQCYHSESKD
jgi:hypothetical protein